MKKTFFFIFFIFLFVFVNPVSPLDPFLKSNSNPLSFTSSYPNWYEIAKVQPSILFEDGIFKMWYGSYDGNITKIAYATSVNGTTWTRDTLLNIDSTLFSHDPSILPLNSQYELYFVSTVAGSSNYKIKKLISLDGYNIEPNSIKTLLTPSLPWESAAVSTPFVVFKNNQYFMFYSGWDISSWKIGMASSIDGENWTRCPNNPIITPGDGPTLFEKDGIFYLFIQGSNGIDMLQSEDVLSCTMNWTNRHSILSRGPQSYDSLHMIGPSLIERNEQLLLYYSGLGSAGWTIDLAASGAPVIKPPVVLVPGFLASWNKEAILHNQQVGIHAWRINPIVQEYKGLVKTFENLNYQENSDFYLFTYDWRKKITDIANDFDQYLQQEVFPTHPNLPINFVGHSLGGLVARIYRQNYDLNNGDKLLTLGSPHKGVAQVYKAVEGGELDRNDPVQWLAQKIVLQFNKSKLQSDRQTLNEKLPVLKNLLPTYNFLLDQNSNEINVQDMIVKNDLLFNYNQTLPTIFPYLQTIVGEKGNTISGFQIGPQTTLDRLLDLYPDGRPLNNRYESGDFVITSNSARADSDFVTLNLDHGEIVYKAEGIGAILNSLQIPYQNDQIKESSATKIFPSLIFLILSPATMEIEFNGQTYLEQDGIIFIEEAQTGNYLLKVTGKDLGPYTIVIGQVGYDKDAWSEIHAQISQIPPTSQTDTYTISFEPINPLDYPVDQTDVLSLFDLLINKLELINTDTSNQNLINSINYLQVSKQDFIEQQGDVLRRHLIVVHRNLFHAITQVNDERLFDAVIQLENLYDRSLEEFLPKPSFSFLQNEFERYDRSATSQEQSLLRQKEQGQNVIEQTNLLLLAKEKLEKANRALQQNNLDYCEILLKSVKELL
ncbi:hypothetical protein HY357_04440 [Candidatus Roizmanbacteria bacterium]|nr:hypothetical protein [Candidatus Roizmanbacteria bacterium]